MAQVSRTRLSLRLEGKFEAYHGEEFNTYRLAQHPLHPLPLLAGSRSDDDQMKSPTRKRRALFDVAVAGPLAGLVVATPALPIGFQTTEVR